MKNAGYKLETIAERLKKNGVSFKISTEQPISLITTDPQVSWTVDVDGLAYLTKRTIYVEEAARVADIIDIAHSDPDVLHACTRCGGDPEIKCYVKLASESYLNKRWCVRCVWCGSGTSYNCESELDAAWEWNRRKR